VVLCAKCNKNPALVGASFCTHCLRPRIFAMQRNPDYRRYIRNYADRLNDCVRLSAEYMPRVGGKPHS
jgi:hypothetical protein